jgi:hypothetical protein
VLLAILDGSINQLCVFFLLGCSKNQRGVGGGILGLVLVNGGKVTRVADDNLLQCVVSSFSLGVWSISQGAIGDISGHSGDSESIVGGTYGARGLQLIERAGHDDSGVLCDVVGCLCR